MAGADTGKLMGWDRNRLGVIGIGLAIVLFFAVNIFANATFTSSRLDLTADRLFTLSSGTKEVLAAVQEPVDIRLYYTRKLDELGPYFSNHARRVDELLSAYHQLSNGNVRIERLDPEPFSAEEDLAVAEGLEGLPLEADGALAYFGLSGRNRTDDIEVIAYLAPERANFLEYDLTRMVHDLASPDKPVVAVIGELPLMGSQVNQFQPWYVLDAMYQFFDVRFLGGKHDVIDDDVDVLVLAQAHALDDASRYAIDQFVMRGGRVLAFVDPLAEVLAAGPGMNPMADPEGDAVAALEPLLTAWGVEIPTGEVVGDRTAAQRVNAQVGGRQVVVDYLPWLALDQSHLAPDDVITGELQRLHMNSAGLIRPIDGTSALIEPLVTSSELAAEINAEELKIAPDPARLIAEFAPTGERYVLAARITGTVASAYPDGPPDGVESESEHLATASEPLHVILVADADMLADAAWVRSQDLLGQQIVVPVANNGDFAINAIDNLTGSLGLMSLRGRGLTGRPFDVIRSMEREAEYKFRAKEQELLASLEETEAKVQSLKQEEQQSGVILTAAEQEEIERFRAEMLTIRQELREVQRSLRADVDRLSTWIKAVNIWAVPVLIAVVALVMAGMKRVRSGRRVRAQVDGAAPTAAS